VRWHLSVIDRPESIRVTVIVGHVEAARWPGRATSSTRQSATVRRLDPASLGDHVDRLYRAARALSNSREEAEDLVQETFERVLQRPRFLHSEDDVGYLLRVLRNTFVSHRRKAARRPQRSDRPDELTWIEDLGAVQPEARLEWAALYQAIAALPISFRDALVAIDVVGLSYAEASRALRVGEATITTRLHRGRQRVAAALAEESGITPAVRSEPLGGG
jgi:RNA polymerase sigma-70 factor (ECF subfamily)